MAVLRTITAVFLIAFLSLQYRIILAPGPVVTIAVNVTNCSSPRSHC